MRKKRTKKDLAVVNPIAEIPKGRSRKKAMIPKETPVGRSPRMRGQVSKESTSSKLFTKESLVQIVSNNSPPHTKTANIPKKPNEECRVESMKIKMIP